MAIFSPDEWQRIEELLDDLLEATADERSDMLSGLAEQEPELAVRVELLLQAHELDAGPLDQTPRELAPELLSDLESSEPPDPDQRIGPYRIVEEIGKGGMGAVFLAVRADDQFQMEVAIKMVAAGRGSPSLTRRFLRERQILATLEHPNVARLLDGGISEHGTPYLVMEYVDGRAIDRYCDERALPVSDRLELFGDVCRAVHYAHTKLVVHRDLKPGNILVTEDGTVKLLDFGIAKLLDPGPDSTGDTVTRAGGRVLTPEYASPEHLQGEPIGTASDVYSLGVLLYELLTGRRPFHQSPSLSDLERAVGEQAPLRPSTVVSDGPEATEVAGRRSTSPGRLRKQLAGDLDNILLTALRKEPDRRYSSARSLLDDVDRHLQGFPVRARPDTVRYRTRKFVRRHVVGLAATVLVLAALIAGLAGTAWQAKRAAVEAAKASEIGEFMISLFEASDPAATRGEEVTARQLLDLGAERARTELAGEPAVQAELLSVLGDTYRKLSLYEPADELLEESLSLRVDLYGPDHLDVAESLTLLGAVKDAAGERDTATVLYAGALRILEGQLPPDDPRIAEVLSNMGILARRAGDYQAADSLHRRALAIYVSALGPDHAKVVESHKNLALTLHAMDRFDEAEPLYRSALAGQIELTGEMHPSVGTTLNSLASLLVVIGQYEEAEELYRRALRIQRQVLGDMHRNTASTLNNLARAVSAGGDLEAAIALLEEALRIRADVLGLSHPAVATSLNDLGFVLREVSRYDEATAYQLQALRIYRDRLGPEHPFVGIALGNLALTRLESGDLVGADTLYATDLAGLRAAGPKASQAELGSALLGIGRVQLASGQPEAAEPYLLEAAELRSDLARGHWRSLEVNTWLARCLIAQGRFEEAKQLLADVLEDSDAAEVPASRQGTRERRRAIESTADMYAAWGRPERAAEVKAQLD